MSIEFCAYDDQGEYDHTLVEPGDGCFIPTFENGEREILGINCDLLDEFGSVNSYPSEGGFEDRDSLYVAFEDLPDSISSVKVDESRPHEQEIVDEEGIRWNLRVRMVSSLAITDSMKIPLGLIYPDKKIGNLRTSR